MTSSLSKILFDQSFKMVTYNWITHIIVFLQFSRTEYDCHCIIKPTPVTFVNSKHLRDVESKVHEPNGEHNGLVVAKQPIVRVARNEIRYFVHVQNRKESLEVRIHVHTDSYVY